MYQMTIVPATTMHKVIVRGAIVGKVDRVEEQARYYNVWLTRFADGSLRVRTWEYFDTDKKKANGIKIGRHSYHVSATYRPYYGDWTVANWTIEEFAYSARQRRIAATHRRAIDNAFRELLKAV